MVIKIPGADFSANAVRVIDIPIEFEAETVAYALHVPVAYDAMSNTKKKALNTFFKALKTNALWSKIENLYLPIFGQTEGGVNLKAPTVNIGFPASGATATYDANGIKFLLGWNTSLTHSWNDIHAGFYNTTSNANGAAARIGISNPTNWWIGRVGSANQTGFIVNGSYRAQLLNHVASIGPVLACADQANKYVKVAVDGEYKEVTDASAFPATANTSITFGGQSPASTNLILDSSIGLFTIGTKLTQAEMVLYAALQTTLMTALMAA